MQIHANGVRPSAGDAKSLHFIIGFFIYVNF